MEEFKKNSGFNFYYPVFIAKISSIITKCDLCQGIYWSYNLKIHDRQNHPNICLSDDKVISNKELSALIIIFNIEIMICGL
jgi:hypothetical protein